MVDTKSSPGALRSRIRRGRWAFYALLVLGLGVRLFGLTFHSLWLDEAVSVYLASFPLEQIFQQGMSLQEPNPPLYHLALAVWMRVFGSGEAAVRSLSVLLGTLYLPGLYLLAKRLFSRRLALIATLIAALNPFLIWYSQEARMYALVATLSLWSLYSFVRLLETPSLSWLVAYVCLTVASLYSHLYAAFLLPAELLFLFLYPSHHRKAWGRGGLGWGLSVLCFSPWLLRAWQLSGTTPSWRPALSLPAMLVACLGAFTVRRVPLEPSWLAPVLAVSGMFALAGLFLPYLPRRGSRPSGWIRLNMRPSVLLGLLLLIPLVLAYLLSFRQQIFAVYYLIVIVAPFILSLAGGVDKSFTFSTSAGLISLLVVVGTCLYGLGFNWSLDYRKEEWRAAARYVEKHAGPGDAILCHVNYTRIPFSYYYGGEVPVLAPFGGPLASQDEVASTLQGLSAYDTVWLVQSHTEWADPGRAVEGWLFGRFPMVTEQYPPGVEVKAYATRYRLAQLPPTAHPVDAIYDGKVRLVGYQVNGEVFSAIDRTYHPPSGWIHVTLYWEPVTSLTEDYTGTVQLIDDAHQVWGGALERPTGAIRFYPPTEWKSGQVVRDDYDINLNPVTPEGTYHLQVSLFSGSGEQLSVEDAEGRGRAFSIGQVRISSS